MDRETEILTEFAGAGTNAQPSGAIASGVSPIAKPEIKEWSREYNRPKAWQGHVYGLVVHTTGGSLPARAEKGGTSPTDYAVRYYHGSRGCHYVNGWGGIDDGDLRQVANERVRARGVGVTNKKEPKKDQRRSIRLGRFEKDLPSVLVKLWKRRWPGYRHSLELLPGTKTANSCYIHVECPPCVYWRNKRLVTGVRPMRAGLRFTKAQHDAIAHLAVDIARRNGWPDNEEWWRTPRLVGHEDLTPISRHDSKGGWDPGYLREKPYFDWDYVYEVIKNLFRGGAPIHIPTRKPAQSGAEPEKPKPAKMPKYIAGIIKKALLSGKEYLAISLALLQGIRDENSLTDMIFYIHHPELQGKRLMRNTPEAREWLRIRNEVVRPALRTVPSSIPQDARLSSGIPALGGQKVPPGFVMTKSGRGLYRYGGGRLDKKLLSMRNEGRISVSDEHIDTLQRIAQVETGGFLQGINTFDSAVVSLGFMQLTLQHGKIQKWIRTAESAFQRYGIELDPNRYYSWRGGKQKAIKGASSKDELRWDGWAERFFLAGLDTEIIAAEVKLAIWYLQRHMNGLKSRLGKKGMLEEFTTFMTHYEKSLYLRGMFHAAYNNLPAVARAGTIAALRIARREGGVTTERFVEIFQKAIHKAYVDRNPKYAKRGRNIVRKTQKGAQFR